MRSDSSVRCGRIIVYAAITLVGLFIVCFAKNQSQPGRTKPAPNAPSTEPAPRGQITLRISFPDRHPVFATQLNGGLIRIKADGRLWGVVPTLTDSTDEVSVAIFEVKSGGIRNMQVREMKDRFAVRREYDSSSQTAPFLLRVEGTKPGRMATTILDSNSTFLEGDFGRQDENRCCISCGGVTVCACAVTAECGTCCSGVCC